MKRFFLLFVISLSFGFSTHAGELACSSLFESGASSDLSSRWSLLPSGDQRNMLLTMLGSNGQPSISRKDIFEKGEMELGLNLGDGRTLILSYQADSRNSLNYKLVQISLLDQVSIQEKIDSRPLEKETFRLTNKAQDQLIELLGQEKVQDRNFVFPLIIDGALLEFLKKTEGWIEQIQPQELAMLKVGEKEFRQLYFKGQRRRFVEFVVKYLPRKVLWKAVEWGAMFAIFSSVSTTSTLPTPMSPTPYQNNDVVNEELIQFSRSEMIERIRQNPLVPDTEKTKIIDVLNRRESVDLIVSESPLLTGQGMELRTINGRDIWIFNRSAGKIYLTSILQYQQGAGVRLTNPISIEIPQNLAPQTFQNILSLFTVQH